MKNLYLQRYVCTLSIVLLLTTTLVAQNKTRSGTVTDAQGALAGVNVLVKNSNRGTITSMDGTFTIQAKPTDSLVFSFIGYLPQTIPVEQQTTIDVMLVHDATALDQVVLNAGYYNVTDREKTGSITKVTAEEIENQPVTNPLAAIQGRMPGVSVVQNTGVPGGGFSIRIRGRNSIRADGSEPLYIIDGVPYPSQSLGNTTVSTPLGSTPQSSLNGINPNDIESIEVLKDADATAIYGSRGANGVVLITTKKGKANASHFNVKTTTGVGTTNLNLKLLNTQQYIAMREEAFANDGFTEYPEFAYDINGTWNRNRYTNWQEELLGGTAYFTALNTSYQGGGEQTQFLLQGNYTEQSTVLPGDFKNKKGSALFNLNHTSSAKNFSIQVNGNYVVDDNNLPSTNLVRQALILPPNAPPLYDTNGDLNWENSTFDNPLAAFNGQYRSYGNYLRANTVLTYRPIKNFELNTNLGYYKTDLEETRTAPSTIYDPAYGLDSSSSLLILNKGNLQSYIIEPQLNYKTKFGKGLFKVLLGTTIQNDKKANTLMYASDFASNNLIYNPAAADLIIESSVEEEYRYKAFFGRINLNWDHKYILNLTGRRDGSSRFGPGNQYANFGAIGAAWLFSNEPFIKERLSFISFGKLRGSYGTTGNDQIGNYGYLDTYAISGQSYQGSQTFNPAQLYNSNFGWETNKKIEAAIELGLFEDRMLITSSYYNNRSSNQLVGIPLPGTTGFSSIQSNLNATVQNTGVELELSTINIRSLKFKWETSLNVTIPKNKLISFPNLDVSTYSNEYVVGQPLDIVKLYQNTGVDPQTGVYTFQDANGDGLINTPADRIASVHVGAKLYGGIYNSFNYKNVALDFLFQFSKQNARNYFSTNPMPGTMANQPVEILNNWQVPGDSKPIQRFSAGYSNEVYMAYQYFYNSTAAISDASYIRLKNIALSYQLPNEIFQGVDCSITLSGQNLITFTNYLGPDPETLSYGDLPPLKLYSLGVEINL